MRGKKGKSQRVGLMVQDGKSREGGRCYTGNMINGEF